jgi:CRP-like cAMP-binding protein
MFEKFRNKIPVSDEKWNDYVRCFKRIEVPARTILLNEGEISRKLFLIEKGCLRVWLDNNGKDVTFQFFFEHDSVSSIESLVKKIPSPVTIEAIEPSILWYIHKRDIERIMAEISDVPVLREKLIQALFERTFNHMKHYASSIKDSPQQRYLNLIREKPQIIQRVPQHYIASYLGISTVHLSRIKNKLLRNRQ